MDPAFPLGLLPTAVIFDLVYLITDKPGFALASAYAIGAGVVGGLVAALFGWVDWFAIPSNTRAKRLGLIHGIGNAAVNVLFALSWLVRSTSTSWEPSVVALTCSFVAIAVAPILAWLGGELVERLGVAVDTNANLDAPSSLTHKHLSSRAA